MAHRFFLTGPLPAEPGQPVPLAASDLHHAVRVLRIRAGEHVEVVEPGGDAFELEVVSAGDSGVVATLLGPIASAGHRLPCVTLFQGVAKGEKMDTIVRQAVEVGAEEIIGIVTSRSVVRLDDAKRASRGERWRRIAKSAAEQAKRSRVPNVPDPLAFADALELLAGYDRVVVLWEEHRGPGIAETLADLRGTEGARVALVVGPEGGLSAEEVEGLAARRATVASLGPTVLRTETAAVVALTLAIAALGGMGGSK